ncbi:hypothetical protein KR018_002077 [Drosophila ironensis]|nr:hypothetical protein KR018_002077 [Drosophila ironensis]
MSHLRSREEVPRDRTAAQELRREITRNSQEISFNFWQEFEHIRATQRSRMEQERLQRERISTMMRDGQQEANQEAAALSRSISSQGLTLESVTLPPPLALTNPTRESALANTLTQVGRSLSPKFLGMRRTSQTSKAANKSKPKSQSEDVKARISPVSSNIPRAPPTSRATMVSTNTSNRPSPDISKIRLSTKPKK